MRKHLLSFVVLVGSAFPAVAAPDKPLTYEERANLTVRLRELEAKIRELSGAHKQAMREVKSTEQTLKRFAPDAGDSSPLVRNLKAYREHADKLRQELVDREAERLKILDRLGRKDTAEPTGRADATLDKILEVLMKIDKRLENLERRVPPR